MIEIKRDNYQDAIERTLIYTYKNGKLPIYTTINGKKCLIKDIIDATTRSNNYYKKNKKCVNKVNMTLQTETTSTTKTKFHQTVEEHVGFKYDTWEQFFAGMGGKGYKYYDNDVYPQGQALDRLKNNSGLNCSDISQIGVAVLKDLGQEAHYGHIKCKEGGHIVIIKGPIKNAVKEGRVWDLAKKISKTSPFVAGANDYWCKDTGTFVSYDDSWLLSDDGVT